MNILKCDNNITNKYRNILKYKLNNDNIYNDINNILNDDIIIIGSTILLGIINNIKFKDNRYIDINLCVNINSITYEEFRYILKQYSNTLKKNNYETYNIKNIIYRETYKILNNSNYNIIELDIFYIDINPITFLNIYTDLNIVKNYYDGKYIYILYYKNLKYKYENIRTIPTNDNDYYRIKKYILRGFHISICHIDLHTLYKNNIFPYLYNFRYDLAKQIIKKYISHKIFKLQ